MDGLIGTFFSINFCNYSAVQKQLVNITIVGMNNRYFLKHDTERSYTTVGHQQQATINSIGIKADLPKHCYKASLHYMYFQSYVWIFLK